VDLIIFNALNFQQNYILFRLIVDISLYLCAKFIVPHLKKMIIKVFEEMDSVL